VPHLAHASPSLLRIRPARRITGAGRGRRSRDAAESGVRKRGAGRASRPIPLRSMDPPHPRPARPAPRSRQKAAGHSRKGAPIGRTLLPSSASYGPPRHCSRTPVEPGPVDAARSLLVERPVMRTRSPWRRLRARPGRGPGRCDAQRTVPKAVGGQPEEGVPSGAIDSPRSLPPIVRAVGRRDEARSSWQRAQESGPGFGGSGPGSWLKTEWR
jgi:hypothetical protein